MSEITAYAGDLVNTEDMTIAENLERIINAKSAIRDAIANKGGQVAEDAKIDQYPAAIEALPSGDDKYNILEINTNKDVTVYFCRRNKSTYYDFNYSFDGINYTHYDILTQEKSITVPTNTTLYIKYKKVVVMDTNQHIYVTTAANIKNINVFFVSEARYLFSNLSSIHYNVTIDCSNMNSYYMTNLFYNTTNVYIDKLELKNLSYLAYYGLSNLLNNTTLGDVSMDFSNIIMSEGGLRACFTNVKNDNINVVLSDILCDYCYYEMFKGALITTPPQLNSQNLSRYCYTSCFDNCTALTTAPDLPATTLTDYCYQYMFRGCVALTQAPDLPATNLTSYSCASMFQNCTSLQKTGKIAAKGSISSYVGNMFSGCTSLKEMTWTATTPPTIGSSIWTNCPENMVIYVPDEAIDAYKAASVWSSRAAYIKPISEKPTE